MRMSPRGLEALILFEGFEPRIYRDAAGYQTIGVGHLLTAEDKRTGRFRNGITRAQALELLEDDVQVAEKAVEQYVDVPLEQHQFDALTSFTFNLGTGALKASTLRRRLNEGDYDAVPRELRRWVKAGGRTVRGLVRRREQEIAIWEDGVYPR